MKTYQVQVNSFVKQNKGMYMMMMCCCMENNTVYLRMHVHI